MPLPFTDPPEHGPMVGAFRNTWRNRQVAIYDHPTDRTLVVTCGRSMAAPPAEDVWTTELREQFLQYIGTFHKVFQ